MTEIEEIHGILHKLSKEDFEKVRFYINKITLKAIEFEKSKVKENDSLHNVSVSDSSDFELQRLFDWLQDTKREPAKTKFTAGMTRNVAREFEYLLKHSR